MSALRIASALAAAPDPYAVLQLKRDASAADVKKAFRTAILLVHPDKAMGCAGAAAAFEAVEPVEPGASMRDYRAAVVGTEGDPGVAGALRVAIVDHARAWSGVLGACEALPGTS